MKLFENWGKTSIQKEIERQEKHEEAIQMFKDQIANLEASRAKYAEMAAKAELNGDEDTYQLVCGSMLELNDMISSVNQAYANYDIITTMNAVGQAMVGAMNALGSMADNKANLPDLRNIQKVNSKIDAYMSKVKVNNKTISAMMKRANPGSKTRTPEELASIRPMIDAARSKIVLESTPRVPTGGFDLGAEIESERQKLV